MYAINGTVKLDLEKSTLVRVMTTILVALNQAKKEMKHFTSESEAIKSMYWMNAVTLALSTLPFAAPTNSFPCLIYFLASHKHLGKIYIGVLRYIIRFSGRGCRKRRAKETNNSIMYKQWYCSIVAGYYLVCNSFHCIQ